MDIFDAMKEAYKGKTMVTENIAKEIILLYKIYNYKGCSNALIFEWDDGTIDKAYVSSGIKKYEWEEVKQPVTFKEVLNSDKKCRFENDGFEI